MCEGRHLAPQHPALPLKHCAPYSAPVAKHAWQLFSISYYSKQVGPGEGSLGLFVRGRDIAAATTDAHTAVSIPLSNRESEQPSAFPKLTNHESFQMFAES